MTSDPQLGPGAALALLRRGATNTDVWLVAAADAPAALPTAAARADRTQWELAEDLVDAHAEAPVRSLYASTLTVASEGRDFGLFGLFVAFVASEDAAGLASIDLDARSLPESLSEAAADGRDAPEEAGGRGPEAGGWMDLTAASSELAPRWSHLLADVRSRFVARPPDEALRLR